MESYSNMRYIPPEQVHVENVSSEADEYVRCTRCGYTGCDVRVSSCNCAFHAVSPLTPPLPTWNLARRLWANVLSNSPMLRAEMYPAIPWIRTTLSALRQACGHFGFVSRLVP
jgi:hypothetical protein